MSPATALRDPIFVRYALLVPFTFMVAGIVLVVLQFRFKKNLGKIWATYWSWWVMGTIALAVIFLGQAAVVAGVVLLGLLAFRELVSASDLRRNHWGSAIVALGIATVPLVPWKSPLLTWICLVVGAAIFSIPIVRDRPERAAARVGLGLVAFVLLGCLFGQLASVTRLAHPYGFVCYVIFATELSDVAAFVFGRLFGRHPLRPRISPSKTWEGAIGALIVSMVLPWLLRFSLPTFGALQLLLTGMIIGIGGQFGDLSISLLKRELGRKDMGTAIPGHGGILDRIDSLIYVAPLFMQLAVHCDSAR